MNILLEGMGCLGSFGYGPQALLEALNTGFAAPISAPGTMLTLPEADTAPLAEFLPVRQLRQVDHFTRMGLLAACSALQDAGLEPASAPQGCGIVMASGYGPASPTFAFLDSILDFGESMASPMAFSHSVHNIPAATTALKLGVHGPCSTVCQLESSVASALLTAITWLEEGRVERVLFGAVDECPPFLQAMTEGMIREAENEREEAGPSPFSRHTLPLGEAAVFFVLTGADRLESTGPRPAVSIREVAVNFLYRDLTEDLPKEQAAFAAAGSPERVLLSGAVHNGVAEQVHGKQPCPAYGNVPIAQALDMVIAAMALSGQTGCGVPPARIACVNFSPLGPASRIVLTGATA